MKIVNVLSTDHMQAVVRMDRQLRLKSKVYDMQGNQIGTLVRVFGPVSHPFGLVSLKKPINEDRLEIRERGGNDGEK
ncbi:MAG: H/ACA RNA-protein complex protein Gar1 [Thermoplasmataceae archaeon]